MAEDRRGHTARPRRTAGRRRTQGAALATTVRRLWAKRSIRIAAGLSLIPVLLAGVAAVYYYTAFARLIDEHLHGTRQHVMPRVFARPLELRRGQALTDRQLIDRLNDLGYTERPQPDRPGEFTLGTGSVLIRPRDSSEVKSGVVRVVFRQPQPVQQAARRQPQRPADRVLRLEVSGRARDRLTLDTPLLTSLTAGEREKRRPVSLDTLPPHVVQAVLAIEDRRYYDHPGVDPIAIVRAVFRNLSGESEYLSGASTITQQVVRNVFLPQFDGWTLARARTQAGWAGIQRKLLEQFVALVLNTRASKEEILELYLNHMPLGQRGSFAIHGVAEAARLFFAKDVTNISVAEAATIAGVLQSPSALNPFNNPERSRERRNVVIQAMADAGYIEPHVSEAAASEPLLVVQRALEAEAPYFVDYVTRTLDEDYPGLTSTTSQSVEVFTTLDLHLQRIAQDAVRDGLTAVDKLLSRRKRASSAEAALVAVDPRTGEVLAMVGGRSYNRSQYNRAVTARRQPGSVFKPFVFLAAFEEALAAGRVDVTPAMVVDDSPNTWEFDDQVWTPANYENEYDGPITLRRALAHSRNLATIKLAEATGYDRVAALWKTLGVGTQPRPYPSIALGVFEASPLEVATAYTLFPNNGVVRPLKHLLRIENGGKDITRRSRSTARTVARPDATYLVTNMMRSVVNEGTGAGVRGAGFTLDAAGKTGTTNDLRDAWFVGFTPELLTVVWVGFDDNQPVGLSGSRAALPIWTQFMTRALSGHGNVAFTAPEGISYVDIDPDTGLAATPACPRVITEAFASGTEPAAACALHRF